jgi:hypothetical protein
VTIQHCHAVVPEGIESDSIDKSLPAAINFRRTSAGVVSMMTCVRHLSEYITTLVEVGGRGRPESLP